ncbi:Cathepsin_L [Hexamita inflata]|uniref:Cathepsin_L n=1 Tax=Hexamita inflata TaxID=28002 RepID=A0ABP1I881_9EUKA
MFVLYSIQTQLNLLVANISVDDSCEMAYDKFINHYDKQPSNESKEIFCRRLQYIAEYGGKLHVHSDIAFNAPLRPRLRKSSSTFAPNCLYELCFGSDPLKPLTHIYKSVSLAEAGLSTPPKAQGDCGSCWAFGTISIFENSVLRQQPQPPFWGKNVDLSEQFLMSNSFAYMSSYCAGGDFVFAANYFNEFFQTVEKEENFKYDYEKNEALWKAETEIPPVIQAENYLKPYQTVKIAGYPSLSTPVVGIHTDTTKTFSKDTIWQIKSYLSRGIAVSAGMYTKPFGDALSTYTGQSSIHQHCPGDFTDHQVSFVGYGYKNNEEVWIIKNSWGTEWGANGYLFVPIGKDSFCLERYAYTVLPIGFKFSEGVYENIGSHKRGSIFELDADDLERVKRPVQQWVIWASVIGCLSAVGIAVWVFFLCKSKKSKKNYKPIVIDSAVEIMR